MSEDGRTKRCPCGRFHPPHEKRRRKPDAPVTLERLTQRVYAAKMDGKAEADPEKPHWWHIHYSGNCTEPVSKKVRADRGVIRAVQKLRCRNCKNCREAKRRYWGNLGANETVGGMEQGLRTWFGTLTLSPAAQDELLQRAIEANGQKENTSAVPAWFSQSSCDERFVLVRTELIEELKRYWKRLRKAGHAFSYLVTIERHKSGLPHVHFLLHEKQEAILKKELAAQWPHGFVKIKLAGGRSVRMDEARKVSWYVVKYITKHHQSRMLSSQRYGKIAPLEGKERSSG